MARRVFQLSKGAPLNDCICAKTVADLAPIMETADSDTYMAAVGLYFNMIKAYHCVYHGVKPKDLKMKAGGKLDPSLTLSLTLTELGEITSSASASTSATALGLRITEFTLDYPKYPNRSDSLRTK